MDPDFRSNEFMFRKFRRDMTETFHNFYKVSVRVTKYAH